MARLAGQIAWITGAGSGIGEAAAFALAEEGCTVILTGRRAGPLEDVAARLRAQGATAHVQPADLMRAPAVQAVADFIAKTFGRLDILVNNAGLNRSDRRWNQLSADGIEEIIGGNLTSAALCARAALALMRPAKAGLLIHTASFAGRFVSPLSGPMYTAAKHGVVAMSHSINMEECVHNIRSTAICPGEVATPILDRRPNPVSAEERARMVQPEDCGALIRFVATMPAHVCLNEILISPTANRSYLAAAASKL
ncbi:MAG: SDR family NAD(P)-dependent oxidoreductase [Rhodospirillales bacterium]|nr:SDR family NAD(P)-dependent oxidoreductase [Rhodospirillales bacterium]